MKIIARTPAENGAYPPIQGWGGLTPPEGYYNWPDSLSTAVFYRYNGFVTLSAGQGTVQNYEPNIEAWEAWKAALPPEPGPEPSGDYVTYGALADAIREGVNQV